MNSLCRAVCDDNCHAIVSEGKGKRIWEEHRNLSRIGSNTCTSTRDEAGEAQERDQGVKQSAGRVFHSPDVFSGNSREHKGTGWWMVKSPRKRCSQMHPSCHMNYSSPGVCTGLGKQRKDFKAGWKDEWTSTRIKGKLNHWKRSQARTHARTKHWPQLMEWRQVKDNPTFPKSQIYLLIYWIKTDATQRILKKRACTCCLKQSQRGTTATWNAHTTPDTTVANILHKGFQS